MSLLDQKKISEILESKILQDREFGKILKNSDGSLYLHEKDYDYARNGLCICTSVRLGLKIKSGTLPKVGSVSSWTWLKVFLKKVVIKLWGKVFGGQDLLLHDSVTFLYAQAKSE